MTATAYTIKNILRGFRRVQATEFTALPDIGTADWQRFARQELERRSTCILQSLDDETLKAVLAGAIDFPALCREISNEVN